MVNGAEPLRTRSTIALMKCSLLTRALPACLLGVQDIRKARSYLKHWVDTGRLQGVVDMLAGPPPASFLAGGKSYPELFFDELAKTVRDQVSTQKALVIQQGVPCK